MQHGNVKLVYAREELTRHHTGVQHKSIQCFQSLLCSKDRVTVEKQLESDVHESSRFLCFNIRQLSQTIDGIFCCAHSCSETHHPSFQCELAKFHVIRIRKFIVQRFTASREFHAWPNAAWGWYALSSSSISSWDSSISTAPVLSIG